MKAFIEGKEIKIVDIDGDSVVVNYERHYIDVSKTVLEDEKVKFYIMGESE